MPADNEPIPPADANSPAAAAPEQVAPPTPPPADEAPAAPAKEEAQPSGPSELEKFTAKWHGAKAEEADPPAAEAPPVEPADSDDDDDDDDDPEHADVSKLEADLAAAETRKELPHKFVKKQKKLLGRLARAEPLADLGADVIATCEAHGWSPQEYTQFMRLGARAKAGDAQALSDLRQMVGGATAPAGRVWTPDDDKWLDKAIAEGAVDVERADEIRSRFRAAAAPQPAPVPAPQPRRDAPPPVADAKALEARGTRAIAEAFDKHTAKLSPADAERVKSELLTALKRHQGAHPDAWGAIADNIVQGSIQRMRAAAPASRPPAHAPLRPTGGQPTAATAPKTGKDAFMRKWHS